MKGRQIERILAVVHRTLRREFRDDFHRRCAYAAFGVRALLQDAGVPVEAVGGDFAAFTMSNDGRRAALRGFAFGDGQSAHFWLEAGGKLLDLGPSFLPHETGFPAVRMPAVLWDLSEPLPAYFRYQKQMRYPASALMSADPAINARCERFVDQCRKRAAAKIASVGFPTWIATGPASVAAHALKKDLWAQGALRFDAMTDKDHLPF